MEIYNTTPLHFSSLEIHQLREHVLVDGNLLANRDSVRVAIFQEGGEYYVKARVGDSVATVYVALLTDIFPHKYAPENTTTRSSILASRLPKCAPNASTPCHQCGEPVPPGKRLKVSLDILEGCCQDPGKTPRHLRITGPVVVCNYRCLVAMILPPTF